MIRDLHSRVANALELVIRSLDNDPAGPKTVLICTHAATMIAIGRALTGQVPEDFDTDDFQCYTASLSTFKRRKDAKGVVGAWDCIGNAETGYLSGGAEKGWCVLIFLFHSISYVLLFMRLFGYSVHKAIRRPHKPACWTSAQAGLCISFFDRVTFEPN